MISTKLQKNLEMTQPLEAFVYRSPSAQIDSLLGPSIAGGHLVSWSGARSSGKSALLRKLAEEMRIAAINVAWIDHQHTLSAADWSIPRAGKFCSQTTNTGRCVVLCGTADAHQLLWTRRTRAWQKCTSSAHAAA